MNDTQKDLQIVDHDQRFREARAQGRVLDVHREASLLSMYMNVLGSRARKLAVVSAYDLDGLAAYQQQGFETLVVNGNRPEELLRMIRAECNWLDQHNPNALVLVTSDPIFAILSSHAAKSSKTDVFVWTDAAHLPKELADTPCKIRDLTVLLPSQNRIAVFLDYENVHISLQRAGYRSEPQAIIQAIRESLRENGEISQISAYADWDNLRQQAGTSLQRELVRQGIETQYLIGENGKNSADMRIDSEVRTWIEKRSQDMNQANTLVLGTGDRDFRDLVKTARDHGLKVIVLSLRASMSRSLGEAATEVCFLDEYLERPIPASYNPEVLKSNLRYSTLVMKVYKWMESQHYPWAFVSELVDALQLGAIQIAQLHRAVETGIFTQSKHWSEDTNQESIALQINNAHPLCQGVEYFSRWVCKRIDYCLRKKGMPYVDTNYLAQGMARDPDMQQLSIGQHIEDARYWLEAACAAGLLGKRLSSHPKNTSLKITTWSIA